MNIVNMLVLSLISFFPALIDSSLGMGYGFTTFVLKGCSVNWSLALCVSVGAALSSPVAAWFVHKVPAKKLRPMIGVMAVLLGLFTLIKAYL